jgi:cellulose synthase/poly-beta-1,6-N-acetylglucosamine synthase-like glycosyltransferase
VVIPAHNEEQGIEETVRSILSVEFPCDRFRVVVVADNCTDRTAAIARAAGAFVMERTDPLARGKGYALRWAFDRLLTDESGIDAVVVIDADSIVSRNYLTVINWYIQHGARVIQTSDLVAPRSEAWNAQMTRVGFLLYNYVRPMGRRVLGGSAGLRGNGMCFTASVLREYPWEAYSVNEDLEYGLHLLLCGVKVVFAPEATVLATMPENPKNAESQRARWEGGRFGLIRKYAGTLLAQAVVRPSVACLDAFLDLVTPALVNLIGIVLGAGLVTMILALFRVHSMLLYSALWMFGAALGFTHLFFGLRLAQADASLYRALLHLPKYALWKLRVYGSMPGRWSKDVWARTARES